MATPLANSTSIIITLVIVALLATTKAMPVGNKFRHAIGKRNDVIWIMILMANATLRWAGVVEQSC